MLRGIILQSNEMKFRDGNIMYKNLVSVEYENFTLLQFVYSKFPTNVGSSYNILLQQSADMKSIKLKLGVAIDDTSKKGIFNK